MKKSVIRFTVSLAIGVALGLGGAWLCGADLASRGPHWFPSLCAVFFFFMAAVSYPGWDD